MASSSLAWNRRVVLPRPPFCSGIDLAARMFGDFTRNDAGLHQTMETTMQVEMRVLTCSGSSLGTDY